MAAGCGPSCAKIILIIVNIIFWLTGAAMLAVGIWMLVDNNVADVLQFVDLAFNESLIRYAAYALIAVGGFVLIVGFFGCCGAIKENRCMLGTYIFLIILIMGVEIAAAVLAFLYKDRIAAELTSRLSEEFNENKDNANSTFRIALSNIERKLKCCGINGTSDYDGVPKSAPISCCKLKPEAVDKNPRDIESSDVADLRGCQAKVPGTYYEDSCGDSTTGCIMRVQELLEMYSTILIGIGIGIACFELFVFIFAVCLCRVVGEDD